MRGVGGKNWGPKHRGQGGRRQERSAISFPAPRPRLRGPQGRQERP